MHAPRSNGQRSPSSPGPNHTDDQKGSQIDHEPMIFLPHVKSISRHTQQQASVSSVAQHGQLATAELFSMKGTHAERAIMDVLFLLFIVHDREGYANRKTLHTLF